MITLGPTLNPCLKSFWLTKARNRVLYGGRSSSKSWDAAGFAILLSNQITVRVLCVRQFQNRIEDSVYSLLKAQIRRFNLQARFVVLKNKIINRITGSEFIFYGLWRSIDEIKSMEAIDICWIEEAHALTEEQWKILEPTLRSEGSQFWIIFNPKLVTDFVWKRFVRNPPPNTITRQINYTENPFLSQTIRAVIEAAKAEDYEEFEHIYLGVPRQDDNSAIIRRAWIMSSIGRITEAGRFRIERPERTLEFEITGSHRLGFDVADSGIDKNALTAAHGRVAHWADLWKGGEDRLLNSCARAWTAAQQFGAHITYDSIGVGASAGAKFAEINSERFDVPPIGYSKFNAGGKVWRPESLYTQQTRNKDHFANIKAQAWWLVADAFRNTYNAVTDGRQFPYEEMIFIDENLPHLMALVDELATPRRDVDKAGRMMVESKKDLQNPKREGGPIPSPNLADSFIMAFAPVDAPIEFSDDDLAELERA
jgi:phage terminase large subunit